MPEPRLNDPAPFGSHLSYDREVVPIARPNLLLTSALVCALTPAGVLPASAQAASAVTAHPALAPSASALAEFDSAWNILRINFVAENNSHVDWDALRAELRPRAEAARSVGEVRVLIREMLERVGQSHFALLPAPVASDLSGASLAPSEAGSLGFEVEPLAGRLVVTRVEASGPAASKGVKPGWVLTEVGGRDITDAIASIDDEQSHVRNFRAWAIGATLVHGPAGSTADLGFLDGTDHRVSLEIVREPEPGQPVKFGHLPTLFARFDSRTVDRNGRAIGVIGFNVWMTAVSRQFDQAVDSFRGADGIVIDLRGNPGGVLTMTMGLSGHFLDAPVNLGTITTRDSTLNLVANPRTVDAQGNPVTPFAGPVAILVDSGSYSASEIFAGGMQAIHRARVFGARTAGGALPAVLESLPGGDVLQYAIGDFTTAAGERIEGHGVVPDTVIAPSRADLLDGRDPVLNAALDWIAHLPETR
jgi:carboxyl-terminal processing protease